MSESFIPMDEPFRGYWQDGFNAASKPDVELIDALDAALKDRDAKARRLEEAEAILREIGDEEYPYVTLDEEVSLPEKTWRDWQSRIHALLAPPSPATRSGEEGGPND